MSGNRSGTTPPILRAPSDDGGVLLAPPPAELDCLLAENRAIRAGWRYDVQGRSLASLAQHAREELLQAALRYTRRYRDVPDLPDARSAEFLLAGHQPELFHPGVWLKNFALGAMASCRNAVAVNLLIDNDTAKATALRVPTGTPESPRLVSVPVDRAHAPMPYEERSIVDEAVFRSFGRRASEVLAPLVERPMLENFWPLACGRAGESGNLGLSLAQARHVMEGRWGLETLEMPQSRVCAAEPFRWFTAHLLAHLPRFRNEYNAAVAQYRRRHHVRSSAHPFPDLAERDGWLEAPFWIWTTSDPRRRALWARRRQGRVVISDGHAVEVELPLTVDSHGAAAVERLGALEDEGVKIRSRALTTTLWARLALSDLFLHGIGGAKYDEVTDRLFERFLGVHPPGLMVASGTLLLPVPAPPASVAQQRELKQRLWQLRHHPECFLDECCPAGAGLPDESRRLAAEKHRWVETPQTGDNARQRCRAIRRVNAALQPYVARQREQAAERLEATDRALEAARLLRRRDFSFCLHPEGSLRHFLGRAFSQWGTACSKRQTMVG